LTPVIFLAQLVFRLVKNKTKYGGVAAFAGVIILPLCMLYFVFQYRDIGKIIRPIPVNERTPENLAAHLPRNYMSERFAGTHFRYHTAYCIYDGWRPPLHDPFLVVSRWFYPEVDEPRIHLEDRVELYRKMFPDRTTFADCYCAMFSGDARSYPKGENRLRSTHR
jgi:hypothetical protein